MVEANPARGLSVSLVSERMRCDLQEGLPGIPSLSKRLEIALDVAKALQYLHAEDMIHRDVKVQNVLVSCLSLLLLSLFMLFLPLLLLLLSLLLLLLLLLSLLLFLLIVIIVAAAVNTAVTTSEKRN